MDGVHVVKRVMSGSTPRDLALGGRAWSQGRVGVQFDWAAGAFTHTTRTLHERRWKLASASRRASSVA
jgi:hypothetical protein